MGPPAHSPATAAGELAMSSRLPAPPFTESRGARSLAGETAAASEADVPKVRVAVGPQNLALGVIATIAAVFALEWAQLSVITLLLGFLFAYTSSPLVSGWNRSGYRVCWGPLT